MGLQPPDMLAQVQHVADMGRRLTEDSSSGACDWPAARGSPHAACMAKSAASPARGHGEERHPPQQPQEQQQQQQEEEGQRQERKVEDDARAPVPLEAASGEVQISSATKSAECRRLMQPSPDPAAAASLCTPPVSDPSRLVRGGIRALCQRSMGHATCTSPHAVTRIDMLAQGTPQQRYVSFSGAPHPTPLYSTYHKHLALQLPRPCHWTPWSPLLRVPGYWASAWLCQA
jgi:hypothetical protein